MVRQTPFTLRSSKGYWCRVNGRDGMERTDGRTGGRTNKSCIVLTLPPPPPSKGTSHCGRDSCGALGKGHGRNGGKQTAANASLLFSLFSVFIFLTILSFERESKPQQRGGPSVAPWVFSVSYTHLTLPTILLV